MSGAISAVSVAGATAAAGGAGFLGTAGAALAANAGAISLGSTLLSGFGAIQQSRAASSSAKYNAAVAANNAATATQNANFAGAEGEQNVAASLAKTRAEVAATKANQGASGVDINSTSFSDVRDSEARVGKLNALNIRSQAARKAYGYQTDASTFTGQQGLYKSEAKSAKTSGYINAATTVLGGAAKAADYFSPKNDVTGGLTEGVS